MNMSNLFLWDSLRHFKRHEFGHPEAMSADLLTKLDECRHLSGVPIRISSDYRENDSGAHGEGKAVDVTAPEGITSEWRYAVLRAAFLVGFRRIGVYDSHIHLDVSSALDQYVCWWGVSR